eukprot:scaffold600_cov193-Ochromonas_danica.AAC.11
MDTHLIEWIFTPIASPLPLTTTLIILYGQEDILKKIIHYLHATLRVSAWQAVRVVVLVVLPFSHQSHEEIILSVDSWWRRRSSNQGLIRQAYVFDLTALKANTTLHHLVIYPHNTRRLPNLDMMSFFLLRYPRVVTTSEVVGIAPPRGLSLSLLHSLLPPVPPFSLVLPERKIDAVTFQAMVHDQPDRSSSGSGGGGGVRQVVEVAMDGIYFSSALEVQTNRLNGWVLYYAVLYCIEELHHSLFFYYLLGDLHFVGITEYGLVVVLILVTVGCMIAQYWQRCSLLPSTTTTTTTTITTRLKVVTVLLDCYLVLLLLWRDTLLPHLLLPPTTPLLSIILLLLHPPIDLIMTLILSLVKVILVVTTWSTTTNYQRRDIAVGVVGLLFSMVVLLACLGSLSFAHALLVYLLTLPCLFYLYRYAMMMMMDYTTTTTTTTTLVEEERGKEGRGWQGGSSGRVGLVMTTGGLTILLLLCHPVYLPYTLPYTLPWFRQYLEGNVDVFLLKMIEQWQQLLSSSCCGGRRLGTVVVGTGVACHGGGLQLSVDELKLACLECFEYKNDENHDENEFAFNYCNQQRDELTDSSSHLIAMMMITFTIFFFVKKVLRNAN